MAEFESKMQAWIKDEQCEVGRILTRLLFDIQGKCLEEARNDVNSFRERVRNALCKMHEAHGVLALGQGVQKITYQDPFYQFGYLYKLSMLSGRSLSKVIYYSRAMENRTMQTSITVACLGGGPGSDVLGVLDYFMKCMAHFQGQLNIQLYDRRDKWAACWGSLKTAINAELYDGRISVSFHDFDVTTDDKNKPNLQDADIITMHYFMEEVYSERDQPNVVECFDYILQTTKPGALFLYSGMYMYQVVDWVHQLLNNCELLKPGNDMPLRPHRNSRTQLTEWIPYIEVNLNYERDLQLFDDIKRDLERFYHPEEVAQRCYGKVIYRLYRKVNKYSHWYW